jgi:hypothetical protein
MPDDDLYESTATVPGGDGTMCEIVRCGLERGHAQTWHWFQYLWDVNPILLVIVMTVLAAVTWRLMVILREEQAGPAWQPHAVYEAPRFDEEQRRAS